jgi:hypothetical protein
MSAKRKSANRTYLLNLPGREVPLKSELEVDIVNEPDIMLKFYHIMKYAAELAVNKMKPVEWDDVRYNVLALGEEGTLRRGSHNRNNAQTIDYFVEYNPKDIYVYGGCALTLYDIALRGLKEKHTLNALEKRVRRKTTDIDLVWFPRVPEVLFGTGLIVTSQSPAIKAMVLRVKKYLERILSRYERELLKLFRVKLADRYEIVSVDNFEVHHTHIIEPGVHNITIKCSVNGIALKLCEMSIHDSGSSQRYNENYEEIHFLQPMTEDVVYCPPNELVHLDIHDKEILVPNLTLYCKQQLFTFGNLLKRHDYEKSLGSFYRVAFVLYLLEPLGQTNRNKRNVRERIDVENIGHTVNEIHEMINHVKHVFHTEIRSLCSREMNDEVRMMLCGPLKHIKGLPSYAMSSRSVSTKKRQAHHNASYQALSRLKKRITDFIQYMYKLMASFTPSTPHHISMDSLQLQEEAYEIERKVIIEIDTPLANHRNLDQTVEALHREIDHLYARYHSLVSQQPRGSLPMVSASSTRSAARPPLHPSMSHQSISRRSHTRKNANNRKN